MYKRQVHAADEAFVTGTFGALTPVRRVDGVRIGSGDGAGPITRRLSDLYRAALDENAVRRPSRPA